MTTRILLVDPEIETFNDLKEKISSHSDQWELDHCSDSRKVLSTIKSNPPEIVICAHRPSKFDGSKRLQKIALKYPHIERFILAEESEKEALESDIGSAFHFLPSPCPKNTLQLELQRVVTLNNWLGQDKIKEIVGSVSDFPSLPPVYMKVVNAVNSPNASVESIAEIIMGDIAVTAKILQTVNSSFFGLEEKVSDIAQAISILGIESVKNIVLAIQAFGKIEDPAQQALVDQLWRHSMSVAIAAKRITKYETDSEKKAEEAYTAGLFHDIGKLVLMKSLPEKYSEARQLAADSDLPQWEAEEKIIGCNHADIGAYLLGRWGLPVNIIESAALHHKPSESFNGEFTILSAVHVGNAIVWSRGKSDKPHPDSNPNEEYLAEIGRAGAWEDWKDISIGKTPETAKPSVSASPSNETSNTEIASSSIGKPAKAKSEHGENRNLVIAAIAAAIVLGLWLILPNSNPNEEESSLANASDDWESGSAFIEVAEENAAEFESDVIASEQGDFESDATVAESPSEAVSENDSDELIASNDSLTEDDALALEEAQEESYSKVPQLRLTGIFYNANNPLASVNGKLLRQGDTVEGAKIVSIEKRHITVSYDGENMQINLPK